MPKPVSCSMWGGVCVQGILYDQKPFPGVELPEASLQAPGRIALTVFLGVPVLPAHRFAGKGEHLLPAGAGDDRAQQGVGIAFPPAALLYRAVGTVHLIRPEEARAIDGDHKPALRPAVTVQFATAFETLVKGGENAMQVPCVQFVEYFAHPRITGYAVDPVGPADVFPLPLGALLEVQQGTAF